MKTSSKKRKTKSHSFWYTGLIFLGKVKSVLGYISIDPASSPEANRRVGADLIYTYEDSCLTPSQWLENDPESLPITCFMNPPYSADCGGTKPFVSKLLEQMQKEVVEVAIVLVNSSTSSSWFEMLLDKCENVCFLSSREKFDEDLDSVRKNIPDYELEDSETGLRTGTSPRYDNAVFLLFSPKTKCDRVKYKRNFMKEFGSMGSILTKDMSDIT